MLHYKKYETYKEYLKDQTAKIKKRGDSVRLKYERQYAEFCSRFSKYVEYLEPKSRILCLGARFGAEVSAFRSWGFNAIGIDIIGDEQDLVIKGDWNDIPFDKNSFNAVYINSIDHCSDIKLLFFEITRVLAMKGRLIIELQHGDYTDEQIEKRFIEEDSYESMLWNKDQDVINEFKEGFSVIKNWKEPSWRCYLLERENGKFL